MCIRDRQVTSYFAKQFPFLKDHLLSVMLFLSLHFFFAVKEDLLCQNRKWHQCLLFSFRLSSVFNSTCTIAKLLLKKDGSPFLYEGFHLVAWHSLNFGWWVMVQLKGRYTGTRHLKKISNHLWCLSSAFLDQAKTKPNKKSVAILSFCSPVCKVRAMPLFSLACHFKFAKCRRNIWLQALSATFKVRGEVSDWNLQISPEFY